MSMLSRRRWVLNHGLAGLALGLPAWAQAGPGQGPWQGRAAPRRKLVVILLRGAVDGLSVLAPWGDPAYAAARPSLALAKPGAEGGALRLDSLFGLHPALARLMPLWTQGSMSFVHASGSPDPTRSHFDAQDYLEAGTPGRKSTPDGWMNRLVAQLPGSAGPTRALNMGTTPPRILAGPAAVATLGLGPRALERKAIDQPALQAGLAKLYAGDPSLARTFQNTTEGRSQMQRSLASDGEPAMAASAAAMTSPAPSAESADRGAASARSFAADARRLGQLVGRDSQTQLAFTSVGGWDTHVNQGAAQGQLANKLASLAEGLEALAQGLGESWRDTVVVVLSEFGRTVRENGTSGTDHGRGNVMWLLGGAVAGGQVLGEWPALETSALAEGRDLAVTTDFRAVLAPVLQRHLGVSDAGLAQVFPNGSEAWAGKPLALLRA